MAMSTIHTLKSLS